MAFASGASVLARRHHEAVSVPALISAITLLVPIVGAWWARVAAAPTRKTPRREGDL
jgi:hypothetical protein